MQNWNSTNHKMVINLEEDKEEREFDLLNDYKVMKKNFPQESGLQQIFLRLQLSFLMTSNSHQ